jgi:hypothetical protein
MALKMAKFNTVVRLRFFLLLFRFFRFSRFFPDFFPDPDHDPDPELELELELEECNFLLFPDMAETKPSPTIEYSTTD